MEKILDLMKQIIQERNKYCINNLGKCKDCELNNGLCIFMSSVKNCINVIEGENGGNEMKVKE